MALNGELYNDCDVEQIRHSEPPSLSVRCSCSCMCKRSSHPTHFSNIRPYLHHNQRLEFGTEV
jgi:hypothetical protein